MGKHTYWKRLTECPDGWWIKGKDYEVKYTCGKAYITDEEGARMYLEEYNYPYLKQEFKKVLK